LSAGINEVKKKFFKAGSFSEIDEPDATSLLGTPIYDTITFFGNGDGGNIVYYDISTQKTVTVPKLRLDIALLNVTKEVRVIKTPIAGRNGTVKQYISLGDYQVSINATVTSETPDTRPEAILRQLNLITDCPTEIQVASHFLSIFGISALVFDGEQNFNMEEGTRDVQRFTLNCLSELPFTIKVQQQGTTSNNNPFNQPSTV
jgi:hypothetical protein